MSFNGLQPSSGPFALSVGSPPIACWVSNGTDQGALWIQASTVGPGTVKTGDFSKARTINPGGQSFSVTYWCTVVATDDGGSGLGSVLFNLDGGGNT